MALLSEAVTSGEVVPVRPSTVTRQIRLVCWLQIMNCIYVSDICRYLGLTTEILYAVRTCGAFTRLYSKDSSRGELCTGQGSISLPVVQAIRIFLQIQRLFFVQWRSSADAILLAKAVDGIYDSDPKVNPNAVKYDEISIQEVVDKKLAAMDLTASIMCLEQKMPMLVFGLEEENSIVNTVHGKFNGTKVTV